MLSLERGTCNSVSGDSIKHQDAFYQHPSLYKVFLEKVNLFSHFSGRGYQGLYHQVAGWVAKKSVILKHETVKAGQPSDQPQPARALPDCAGDD